MKRIERLQDQFEGTITFDLEDGRFVTLDQRAVKRYGLREMLRAAGVDAELPDKRLPVFQRGREIGSVPGDFEPTCIKSTSWLYDPRPGDFRRDGKGWIAADSLGLGDLEAVHGFVRDHGGVK
jgi:hypothetical protein